MSWRGQGREQGWAAGGALQGKGSGAAGWLVGDFESWRGGGAAAVRCSGWQAQGDVAGTAEPLLGRRRSFVRAAGRGGAWAGMGWEELGQTGRGGAELGGAGRSWAGGLGWRAGGRSVGGLVGWAGGVGAVLVVELGLNGNHGSCGMVRVVQFFGMNGFCCL
jgi:hypothetical protein